MRGDASGHEQPALILVFHQRGPSLGVGKGRNEYYWISVLPAKIRNARVNRINITPIWLTISRNGEGGGVTQLIEIPVVASNGKYARFHSLTPLDYLPIPHYSSLFLFFLTLLVFFLSPLISALVHDALYDSLVLFQLFLAICFKLMCCIYFVQSFNPTNFILGFIATQVH